MNPWAEPSEHSEQAPTFIKNFFQTTALLWILSLGKKSFTSFRRKNISLCYIQKTSGRRVKGHCAPRWMERILVMRTEI